MFGIGEWRWVQCDDTSESHPLSRDIVGAWTTLKANSPHNMFDVTIATCSIKVPNFRHLRHLFKGSTVYRYCLKRYICHTWIRNKWVDYVTCVTSRVVIFILLFWCLVIMVAATGICAVSATPSPSYVS